MTSPAEVFLLRGFLLRGRIIASGWCSTARVNSLFRGSSLGTHCSGGSCLARLSLEAGASSAWRSRAGALEREFPSFTLTDSIVFFRFAAGLLLVVLVSMAGVRLEKQTLEMRRAVSLQYYQTDLLLELLVRLRLETQRLTAPAQLAATIEDAANTRAAQSAASRKTRAKSRVATESENPKRRGEDRLPLLRFQHPFNPQGID